MEIASYFKFLPINIPHTPLKISSVHDTNDNPALN